MFLRSRVLWLYWLCKLRSISMTGRYFPTCWRLKICFSLECNAFLAIYSYGSFPQTRTLPKLQTQPRLPHLSTFVHPSAYFHMCLWTRFPQCLEYWACNRVKTSSSFVDCAFSVLSLYGASRLLRPKGNSSQKLEKAFCLAFMMVLWMLLFFIVHNSGVLGYVLIWFSLFLNWDDIAIIS